MIVGRSWIQSLRMCPKERQTDDRIYTLTLNQRGGGTTQEEIIDWGEVAGVRRNRHPRDAHRMRRGSPRRSRRLGVKQPSGSCVSSRLGVRIVESRPFSRRGTEIAERNASPFLAFPGVRVGRLPSPARLGGGHNRDAVVSGVGSKPRVILVPRPTLGWGSQRRWRWQGMKPAA